MTAFKGATVLLLPLRRTTTAVYKCRKVQFMLIVVHDACFTENKKLILAMHLVENKKDPVHSVRLQRFIFIEN
jgi:hypothetical protein